VLSLHAQHVTVSGFVKDAETGELLLFADCVDTLSKKGSTTNAHGFYSLSLPVGNVRIRASYLGYEQFVRSFTLSHDTTVNIELTPRSDKLSEVVINAYTPVREQVTMGKTTIPVKTLKAIPSFVGEPDLMKAISYLPGVSSGKEGYSNIYVRGGDRGQNLFLLDGVKLYNTNHVGGFLSLFNSDVIKQVDVYKDGFPARYGGRASSVIDVYTKDGTSGSLKGKFNLGLLYSSLMLEGGLRENMSYYMAVRASYYDLFTISARRKYRQTGLGEFSGYTFLDVNGKFNWRLSGKDKLSVIFFTGNDLQKTVEAMEYSAQTKHSIDRLKIQSTGISLTHTHVVNPKVFLKNNLGYSRYSNRIESLRDAYNYGSTTSEKTTSSSMIDDITLQSRLEIIPNHRHAVKTGVEISHYRFVPGIQTSFYENENAQSLMDTTIGFTHSLTAYEGNVYLEDEIKLTDEIKFNLGMRGTGYFCKDTVYFRIEPRISFIWLMSGKWAFKANYTVLNQYNHVLVNNYYGFEKEIWLAATGELQPQKAKQISGGFFYGNNPRNMDISIELFYKKMTHLLEYKSPVRLEDNLNNIENITAKNGKGEAYGVEFQLKKEYRKITGSLNYTLSWNNRQFDELNNGAWFPFIYDRRHDLSLLTMWQITDRYSLNGNFVLSSGASCTLPVAYSATDQYVYQYYIYEKINNRRLPAYHRLDIALVRKGKTKKGRQKQFSINIFNVYARQNPVYVYYDVNTGKVYQKSLFSIIPTINYSVEF
jgi:outer membrane receptor for ferrienterochelin and colicin